MSKVEIEVTEEPEKPILPGPPTLLAEWAPMRVLNEDGSYRTVMAPLRRRFVDLNPKPAPSACETSCCKCKCQNSPPPPPPFIPPRPGQELMVEPGTGGMVHDPELSDLVIDDGSASALVHPPRSALPMYLPVTAPEEPGPARREWAHATRGPDFQTGMPMGHHLPPISIAAPRNKYGLYSSTAPGMRYVG